ncbi:hypothetical protein [Streptomyces sp. NBC_00035]|uniref:hypothetical protein n=1 Tax=Streptomyces sp. NBC_00035 TaxID=2903614 RepID=UPI0032473E95
MAANGLPTPAMVLARHRLPVHAGELRAERRALAPYAAFRERHYEPYLAVRRLADRPAQGGGVGGHRGIHRAGGVLSHAEAHIQWAFITLMSRRLTRSRRQTEASPATPAAAWNNKMLLWSYDKMAQFSALDTIELLTPTPLLLIADTKAETLQQSQAAYDAAQEPKELFLIEDGTHFDFYDRPAFVTPAVTKIDSFLRNNL